MIDYCILRDQICVHKVGKTCKECLCCNHFKNMVTAELFVRKLWWYWVNHKHTRILTVSYCLETMHKICRCLAQVFGSISTALTNIVSELGGVAGNYERVCRFLSYSTWVTLRIVLHSTFTWSGSDTLNTKVVIMLHFFKQSIQLSVPLLQGCNH